MATITFKINYQEKEAFAKLAEDCDLSMAQLLRDYIRKVLKESDDYGNKPRIRI